mmetsp:Transcript_12403/g.29733  ORF Transcript_12403/g.29733 Transcript_12403/m.29733 type:complete len:290 (-) Transcript_12403:29-898(-)
MLVETAVCTGMALGIPVGASLLAILQWIMIPLHTPQGETAKAFPRPPWLSEGVNWAVVGESGAGKSGLVNGLRGVKHNDPGAAPEGMTEMTITQTKYLLFQNRNFALWDMPGHGTAKVPTKHYFSQFGLLHFHGVIICIKDGRVLEDNIEMVRMLQKHQVPFYIVQNRFFSTLEADVADTDANLEDSAFVQGEANKVAQAIHLGFRRGKVDVDFNRIFLICSRKLVWAHGARFNDSLMQDLQLMSWKASKLGKETSPPSFPTPVDVSQTQRRGKKVPSLLPVSLFSLEP